MIGWDSTSAHSFGGTIMKMQIFVLPSLFLFSACGGGSSPAQCESSILENMNTIYTAEIVMDAKSDTLMAAARYPALVPEPGGTDWGGGNKGFAALNFKPEGKVHGQYTVTTSYQSGVGGQFKIDVLANCAEGEWSLFEATKGIKPKKIWGSLESELKDFDELFANAKKSGLGMREGQAAAIRLYYELKVLAGQ